MANRVTFALALALIILIFPSAQAAGLALPRGVLLAGLAGHVLAGMAHPNSKQGLEVLSATAISFSVVSIGLGMLWG